MSRKTPLTSETTKLFIVIRKNKKIPLDFIKRYCDDNLKRYAFIEHYNHISPDTGEVIPVHYHIVGDSKRSRVALSTQLNTIVKFFKFDNPNGIEIEQYDSFEGALQYLTHKNNKEKTQEDKSSIIHNLTDSDFDIFYNADIGHVVTFELLYSKCLSCRNIIEVIKELGIGTYRNYRQVIWDIWFTLKDKGDYSK